jgi:nucleoside-diphosphate-sugar epimerase
MTEIDIVIISWAKNQELHEVTKKGIQTLFSSCEKGTMFHVYIVESNHEINYDEFNKRHSLHTCTTIHPNEEFGYNRFLNIGRIAGKSPYVALCNSDLIYEPSWSENIVRAMISKPECLSASPWCPQTQGDNTPHLIFSSSCTVYGIPHSLPVTEEEILKEPLTPYGWTKYIGEKIIAQWASTSNTNCILLRYFNPIGAHPSCLIGELPKGIPNNLVPYITQTAAGKIKELTINGDDYKTEDGTCIRDFIHVCDLSDAHVCAINYINKESKISFFNIGTGRGYSVKEIVDIFEKVNGIKIKKNIGKKREGDIPEIWASTNKASTILGWKPKFSMSDALIHSWEWEKNLNNLD